MVQCQSLSDGAPGLSKLLRYILVRIQKLLAQLDQPVGLLEGTQIAPLEVLDKADFEDSPVVDIDLDTGDLREPRLEGGAVSAFARDDLKLLPGRPNQDRLEDSLFLDR